MLQDERSGGANHVASPSSSSRSSSSSSATLGRMPGPPHHLQGKRLDSTPVMALNNNLGLPRLCNSLCPLARRHPQGAPRPATLPPRSLAVTISTRFFSLPPSAASALRRKRYPCCLWAQFIFHFKRFFFFSPERTSLRASGALFVRRDAFCSGMTLIAPSFCPYIITLLFHYLATVS